ncbi:MAG TPA: glycosyltransferase family 39 protein [Acidimicrobiales bacterium]
MTNVAERQRRNLTDVWHRQVADRPIEERLALLAVGILTAAAAAIRGEGFSNLGLFRDDAWVALSSRTGLGTAWHMWVTAPGFMFLERTFIIVGPSATWWDQIPPFVAGVLAVPVIYAVVRYFGIGRIGGLVGALFVCVSPVCITYSTRIKEYSLDLLLTCLLLVVVEQARRTGGRRQIAICAAVSVAAFLLSASTAVVIVGAWLALGLLGLRDRSTRGTLVPLGAIATAGCAVVAVIFYGHISPALNRFWSENSGFIQRGSASQFVTSLHHTAWSLLSGTFDLPGFSTAEEVLIIAVWLALSSVSLYRNRILLAPGLVVLVAVIGSAAHVMPLGTGRTDEYLYPVLLVLPLAGGSRVIQAASPHAEVLRGQARRAVMVALATVATVLSFLIIDHEATVTPAYPGVGVQQLAAEISQNEKPGDHIFVNELMRYPWALYESHPLRIELGQDWSTGFTVVSTDPSVFIDPSEDYEGDQHPVQWAKEMNRYTRLWYVWSPPLGVFTFSYGALLGDGWHVAQTLTAPGCEAYLLVRTK